MRSVLPLLLLLACSAPAPELLDGGSPDAGSPDAGVVSHPELPPPQTIGGARPAKVVTPATYDARTPLPVIFLLGGYANLASDLDGWIDVSGRVDKDGFLLVLPDGTIDSQKNPFWNATDTCCDEDHTGIDDVGYLWGLLDELERRFAVDAKRVYFMGHSNGGFMAYRMACEDTARVAAIVSLAGSTFLDEAKCHASGPVSVLQVHGDDDDVMPFDGDDSAPGAIEVMHRWGTRAGCDLTSWQADATKHEYVDDNHDRETTVRRYASGCASGIDVNLWEMRGNGHYPDFRPVFTRDAVAWLLAHHR